MEWILSPKILELLKNIRYNIKKIKKNNRRYWKYTPITTGLHKSSILSTTGKTQYWLSLNKELRPGIIISDSISLSIKLSENNSGWIQFGIGKNKKSKVKDVHFSINNSIVSSISNINSDEWHTVRISFPQKITQYKIDINLKGDGKLFFSSPQIFQNKSKTKRIKQKKNIICIVLDGLTSELFNEKLTPNICKFFSDGVTCTQAFSQGDWTLPAFSSMLTGLYPTNHGVVNPNEFDSALDGYTKTLPEILKNNGFRTFGYSSHLRFSPAYGHAKGFERFFFNLRDNDNFYFKQINEVSQHLFAHKEESNFLFLHFFDTHSPFNPSGYLKNILMDPIRDRNSSSLNLIMNELEAKLYEVDFALGFLFNFFKAQPWFKESTIILTADHGHGLTEGREEMPLLLFDRVNVPLFVRNQELLKGINNSFIECGVDLMPSILHMAGIKPSSNIDGKIWPFLGGRQRKYAFSESAYVDTYNAVFRNTEFCYHLQCPYDQKSGTINLEQKEPVIFYKKCDEQENPKINSSFLKTTNMPDSYMKILHDKLK